ncbi:MAG: AAA family ATPase [Defluviitaleaceae bacterium]|nr:AAA family ATPase [Defluviitaleaceae bacterium]
MNLDALSRQICMIMANEAHLQRHEFVTPEHFLYGTLMFDIGKQIVEFADGNISAILADLQTFFAEHIPKVKGRAPVKSYDLMGLFDFAREEAVLNNRKEIGLVDILTAIFKLHESHAKYFLLKNGFNFEMLLEYKHQTTSEPTGTGQSAKKASSKKAIKYTINLCEQAKNGKLDPLIGRNTELTRTIRILCRRLKNNPVHVGEPGVGKTAIAEGLASKIVAGEVPNTLKNAVVLQIDMATLLAGTKYRGDFEERLIKLLDEVSKLANPIIYIDEIHTVVGAGLVSGSAMDATGIIKPYLAKGAIRFIGSTTFDEFKKHFEKDRALARRFQRIDVSEPTNAECVEILTGLQKRYEDYHKVAYSPKIMELIVDLAVKYVHGRFLPDKAIDIMDEVGVTANLANVQKVSVQHVKLTVAEMAKIPVATISSDKENGKEGKHSKKNLQKERLKNLDKALNAKVFGQQPAVEIISHAIKMAHSGLNEPERPFANLLFVGPTGVGKTEIAKQLAEIMGIPLTRFDMSEYQERHAVARLIGAPPGYIGFDEGGLLTETIRRTPHCVLLLDEIEKAHADILNILLQVMDYGKLTDNVGRQADFSNVILIMTSNAGAADLAKKIIGFGAELNTQAVNKAVERIFSPEFRNRLDNIVQFNPINDQMAVQIVQKTFKQLKTKLAAKGIKLQIAKTAIDYIAKKGLSEVYGAREIIRVIEQDVKKMLVNELLFGDLENGGTVALSWDKNSQKFKFDRR